MLPHAMLVIKKYPNRRLYDTKESRYITLEGLATMVREGADVVVQDATNGADLTQATLMQIILDSRGGARLLPIPLLVRLIRLGDEALAEFLGRYVSWALEMYVQARSGARALMPLNPLANAPFAATDALARLVLGATQWASGAGPAASAAPPMPPPMPIPEEHVHEPYDVAYPPDAANGSHVSHATNGSAPGSTVTVVEAEAAHAATSVSGVADDLARLRREIDELKRSMTKPARAARPARNGKKAPPKKR